MSKTRIDEINREIQHEERQLKSASDRYSERLRDARSLNTGSRLSTVWAQGMAEDIEKKFYEEQTNKIHANIARLREELEKLTDPEGYRRKQEQKRQEQEREERRWEQERLERERREKQEQIERERRAQQERIEQDRRKAQEKTDRYNRLVQAKNRASTEKEYQDLAKQFRSMDGNAEDLAKECDNKYRELKEKREAKERKRKNLLLAFIVIVITLLLGYGVYNGWFAFVFNRSITIPESVTVIRDSEFAGKQLTSVVIHDSVTFIGNSAFSRNGLTNVVIPAGVTFVGENAFKRNKLNSITIGANVTLGSNAFGYGFENFYHNNGMAAGTYTLTKNNGNEWSVWHGNFRFQNENGNITIVDYNGTDSVVEIPEEISAYQVKVIGDSAFFNKHLTSVSIPNSITSIRDYAFFRNQLTSVSIPNSVTSIGDYAFLGNQLTNVNIPNSVTSIGRDAFSNNQLTNVNIPNSITSIGICAFSYNQLTSVSIPNSVTSIGNAAFSCNQLTNVNIPNSVTSIGSSAFSRNQLTSVSIPNSVTSIGVYAFGGNQITSVTIGANVELGKEEYRQHGQGGGPLIRTGVLGSDVDFNDVYIRNGSKAGTYTYNNNSGWTKKEKENVNVHRVIIHYF